jgi:circadian clock protein KaiC
MERKFIKTGIPGLDPILGGGLLEGSVVTVSGPTGSGKSTLAAQFIYGGAMDYNEPGMYICLEENRRDFFFHNSGYEWDFATLEKDRKFILLDYPIHEVDQIVNQASAISEIISSTGTRRVVIDSIMPVALFFKGDEERKRGFLKFIENLHKWNVTTLIVSEDFRMSNSGARPSSEFGIESFTDGWINLFYKFDEKTMERSRFIEVIKMKGIAHSGRAYPAVLGSSGFSVIHEAGAAPVPVRPKIVKEKPQKEPEEAVISIEPGEITLPHPSESRPPPSPPPSPPEMPMRPLSAKRRLVRDEEMEQLKKLLAEEMPKKAKPAPAKPAGSILKSGKAPAKMSPSIQAKLDEVKKKIMKKK